MLPSFDINLFNDLRMQGPFGLADALNYLYEVNKDVNSLYRREKYKKELDNARSTTISA